MTLDEAKLGGGSGGGPHDDIRDVDGSWARHVTDSIDLLAVGGDSGNHIQLSAGSKGGSDGAVLVDGAQTICIAAGDPSDSVAKEWKGVRILVDDSKSVVISCGGVGSSRIIMHKDQISIQAGQTGTLWLSAGHSCIQMNAAGITINGPLIKIN